MTRLRFALFFALMLTILSCSDAFDGKMTVVKDCSGTYLEYNDKDYKVCNFEILENYADGAEVEARFKKMDKCPILLVGDFCDLGHINEGLIDVKKIN